MWCKSPLSEEIELEFPIFWVNTMATGQTKNVNRHILPLYLSSQKFFRINYFSELKQHFSTNKVFRKKINLTLVKATSLNNPYVYTHFLPLQFIMKFLILTKACAMLSLAPLFLIQSVVYLPLRCLLSTPFLAHPVSYAIANNLMRKEEDGNMTTISSMPVIEDKLTPGNHKHPSKACKAVSIAKASPVLPKAPQAEV